MFITLSTPQTSTTLHAANLIGLLPPDQLHELLSDSVAVWGVVPHDSPLHRALLEWARQNVSTHALLGSGQPMSFSGPERADAANVIGEYHPELLIPITDLLQARDIDRWTSTDLWLREALTRASVTGDDQLDELEAWYRLFQSTGLDTAMDTLELFGSMERLGEHLAGLEEGALPEWASPDFDSAAYAARVADDHRQLVTLSSGRLAYFS